MNDAKRATPVAELERQICSSTEPKNEREWWAHREIERLRDRLSVETLALVEALARAERAETEAAGADGGRMTHDGRRGMEAALAAAGVEEMVREAVRKTADAAFVALGETTENRIVNEVMGK